MLIRMCRQDTVTGHPDGASQHFTLKVLMPTPELI
jgi:hypothetical protein